MKFTHLNNSQENFYKEHRFLYVILEGWEALGAAAKGLGTLFEAGAKLMNVGTGVAEKAASAMNTGFDITKVLLQKGLDKIQGGTLRNLPEYEELGPLFVAKSTSGEVEFSNTNEQLNSLTNYDINLACLRLRIDELQDFYKPVLNEYDYIIEMENRSKSMDFRKEKNAMKNQIERRKLALKTVPKGSDEYDDIKRGLAEDIADLAALEALSSDSPERPAPMIQEREWPPASGKYIRRLVFDKNKLVKLNLKEYKKFLKKSVEWYFKRLDEFHTEVGKIDYYKQNLLLIVKNEFTFLDRARYEKNKKVIAELLKKAKTDKNRKPHENAATPFNWYNR